MILKIILFRSSYVHYINLFPLCPRPRNASPFHVPTNGNASPFSSDSLFRIFPFLEDATKKLQVHGFTCAHEIPNRRSHNARGVTKNHKFGASLGSLQDMMEFIENCRKNNPHINLRPKSELHHREAGNQHLALEYPPVARELHPDRIVCLHWRCFGVARRWAG